MQSGSAEVVQRLLDAKADLGLLDSDQNTPAGAAQARGHPSVAELLALASADA